MVEGRHVDRDWERGCKNRDNPKAWCTRARSRDTRHERGQDVNVDEDKERAREESPWKEGKEQRKGNKGTRAQRR